MKKFKKMMAMALTLITAVACLALPTGATNDYGNFTYTDENGVVTQLEFIVYDSEGEELSRSNYVHTAGREVYPAGATIEIAPSIDMTENERIMYDIDFGRVTFLNVGLGNADTGVIDYQYESNDTYDERTGILKAGEAGTMNVILFNSGTTEMILTSLHISAAFVDKNDIVNTDAVAICAELGIIEGKDNNIFDPEGLITRGEMAKMMTALCTGGEGTGGNGTEESPFVVEGYGYIGVIDTEFTDISAHWAENDIKFQEWVEGIHGKSDGIFDPDGTLTGLELAKVLLNTLGYSAEIEGFIGEDWDTAVNNVANNSAAIFADLNIDLKLPLTRDSAAKMISNALNANTVSYVWELGVTESGGFASAAVAEKNKTTLLEEKFPDYE